MTLGFLFPNVNWFLNNPPLYNLYYLFTIKFITKQLTSSYTNVSHLRTQWPTNKPPLTADLSQSGIYCNLAYNLTFLLYVTWN